MQRRKKEAEKKEKEKEVKEEEVKEEEVEQEEVEAEEHKVKVKEKKEECGTVLSDQKEQVASITCLLAL